MRLIEFSDTPRTLFASRPLLNTDDVREWAKQQGFMSTLADGDMHVTIAFSKESFSWGKFEPSEKKLTIQGGEREVKQLGDAITLCFPSHMLHDRWQEFREAGASWDFPRYLSHVTISYELGDLKLENVEPYNGELVFGPEKFKEVNDDWADNVKEVDL